MLPTHAQALCRCRPANVRTIDSIARFMSFQEEAAFLKALDRFGATQVASTSVEPSTGRVSVRLGPGVAEMMAILIGTRSCAQVRSHVQKHFIRLERERTKMLKQKTNMH